MKRIHIVYPVPFDAWYEFYWFVQRFADSFREYPPGIDDYVVHAVCCWGEPTDFVRNLFYGIKTVFHVYNEDGADIGAAQWLAKRVIPANELMLMMTTRCYLHRPGWLWWFKDAREKHGSGLYGTSANHDGHRLHLCTRGYAMDALEMATYPHIINSRAVGPKFEVGVDNPNGNLLEWFESRGLPVMLLFFDGGATKENWFKVENRFRHGDQSNMLIWDKHSDLWLKASPEERARLTKSNLPHE